MVSLLTAVACCALVGAAAATAEPKVVAFTFKKEVNYDALKPRRVDSGLQERAVEVVLGNVSYNPFVSQREIDPAFCACPGLCR